MSLNKFRSTDFNTIPSIGKEEIKEANLIRREIITLQKKVDKITKKVGYTNNILGDWKRTFKDTDNHWVVDERLNNIIHKRGALNKKDVKYLLNKFANLPNNRLKNVTKNNVSKIVNKYFDRNDRYNKELKNKLTPTGKTMLPSRLIEAQYSIKGTRFEKLSEGELSILQRYDPTFQDEIIESEISDYNELLKSQGMEDSKDRAKEIRMFIYGY